MKLQGNTILWILVGIVLIGLFSQARPPADRVPRLEVRAAYIKQAGGDTRPAA